MGFTPNLGILRGSSSITGRCQASTFRPLVQVLRLATEPHPARHLYPGSPDFLTGLGVKAMRKGEVMPWVKPTRLEMSL